MKKKLPIQLATQSLEHLEMQQKCFMHSSHFVTQNIKKTCTCTKVVMK